MSASGLSGQMAHLTTVFPSRWPRRMYCLFRPTSQPREPATETAASPDRLPSVPMVPAGVRGLPSVSIGCPACSSSITEGRASKSCVFMVAMASMSFSFMSSSSAASWHVGGRHNQTVRLSMRADSPKSQKPWQPTALWSAMRWFPPARRCICEATRFPKQTSTCWSFFGACTAAALLGDMKLVKGNAVCQSASLPCHHLAAAQFERSSPIVASFTWMEV
mmetsp:Transcript_153361/g.471807  ORF Transcript_153361/g.471807 Transcript_153361/m.471807 type:complete len:220 (-) Transcript_153361:152-811(-)